MDNMQNNENIIANIIKFIRSPLLIRTKHLNSHLLHTIRVCLQNSLNSNQENPNEDDYIFEIESILDYLHEELNTGHWSKVPIESRQNFTIASLLKAILLLRSSKTISSDIIRKSLKSVDLGLLLGAPLEENSDLLTNSAKYLRTILNQAEAPIKIIDSIKRKLDEENYFKDFDMLDGIVIEKHKVPSIESFNNKYFMPQKPVKLLDCMTHWPASSKWLDLNYLLKIAGDRTVPIEIGSHYTDENWSQKLMTLHEFISKHYLSETGDVGYLAQHNLFDQISELKDDMRIPEYCCCSLDYEHSTEPDINAWLGPKGTVSPLHQDPKNNILAQVYGTKQVILYSPEDTIYLYPHDENMLSNTARVDPLRPNYEQYPEFKKATRYKCLLQAGEMLFIPVKWWHHVTAFEKSFSVSFWWQ